MTYSRKSFFDCFRAFHKSVRGNLTAPQVAAISFLLDRIEKDIAWDSTQQVAYALATVAHETGWTFEPIKEYRDKVLSAAQKKYWPSGYFGRGYVQLTWDYNYKKAGDKLGLNLLAYPSKVMEPEIAYAILARGMREGWFTGKKLDDYITIGTVDYKNARRIINGTDKAALIAGYAKSIEGCLTGSLEDAPAQPEAQETAPKTPTETVNAPAVLVPQAEPPKAEGFKTQWAALTTLVGASGSAIIGWLTSARAELILGAAAVLIIVGITYMILRHMKQEKAEARTFELTKIQLESAMNRNVNTVQVAPNPLESGDTQEKA